MRFVRYLGLLVAMLLAAYGMVWVSNSHAFDPLFGSLDNLKRDQGARSAACRSLSGNPKQLVALDNVESGLADNAWRCSLQYHELQNSNDGYNLAFLEFGDDGSLRSQHQFSELMLHFSAGKHFVITYVHGWRHDAERDSPDVANFRVMLAYARQFLAQRCLEEQRYCEHKLTGVYVAWNGRARVDCRGYGFCAFLAAPSLYYKKPVSDRLAEPVVRRLQSLDTLLKANNRPDSPEHEKNKLLITGHSLGGNILARGLKDQFETAVRNHEARTVLKPPVGDLVVLFNPASAAENWTGIQRAVRNRYGVRGTRYRFGSDDTTAYNAHVFFPLSQRPVYVSLTSACDWPEFVTSSQSNSDLNRAINCDTATYYLFRLFRMSRGRSAEEETNAIGHVEPTDRCGTWDGESAHPPPAEERTLVNVGTTHELEIGAPVVSRRDRYTTYKNAMDPVTSRCDSGAGWLYRVKQRARELGSPSRTLWDGGATPGSSLHWMNRELRLRIQFRHSIYRGFSKRKGCGGFEITTANDPFWNVRALDSAVKYHGRFSSYPTWCAINQLVLDDVAAKDAPFAPDTGAAPMEDQPE